MQAVPQIDLKLRERDVTRQIKDFLSFRGWRIIRNNVSKVKDKAGNWTTFGENGMPDLLALYYLKHEENPGVSVSLWIEVKQKTGRLRPQQAEWHRNELALGGLVVVARNYEDFEAWYWEVFSWVHNSRQGQGHLFAPSR